MNFRYVSDFHDPDDEPEGQYFNDQYENEEYSISEWKGIYLSLSIKTSNLHNVLFKLKYLISTYFE